MFFVLDSSRGLGYRELPTVINFIQEIVRRLYTKPNNIEIGLMHYSDLKTARFALQLKKRSLQDALDGINNIAYRIGKKNFLGHALKTVRKVTNILFLKLNLLNIDFFYRDQYLNEAHTLVHAQTFVYASIV